MNFRLMSKTQLMSENAFSSLQELSPFMDFITEGGKFASSIGKSFKHLSKYHILINCVFCNVCYKQKDFYYLWAVRTITKCGDKNKFLELSNTLCWLNRVVVVDFSSKSYEFTSSWTFASSSKMTYFSLNGSQEQLGSPVSMDASTTHTSKALGSLQKRK